VCAQRGGSHGGFSGHSAASSHGSFGGSGTGRFASAPHYSGNRSFSVQRGGQRSGGPGLGARPGNNRSWRYRRPYISPYGVAGPYLYPGYIPGYLGNSDDSGNDDSSAPPSDATQAYDAQGADQPLPPYPNQPAPIQAHPALALDSDDAVTLVFKDGRPQEQIHNYVLTRAVLYVDDAHRRVISLDQLDVAATEKVNQDAGVDFHVPSAPR